LPFRWKGLTRYAKVDRMSTLQFVKVIGTALETGETFDSESHSATIDAAKFEAVAHQVESKFTQYIHVRTHIIYNDQTGQRRNRRRIRLQLNT
jgi:hypothetical protein